MRHFLEERRLSLLSPLLEMTQPSTYLSFPSPRHTFLGSSPAFAVASLSSFEIEAMQLAYHGNRVVPTYEGISKVSLRINSGSSTKVHTVTGAPTFVSQCAKRHCAQSMVCQ
ncbi:hypothetical protein AVEN_48793-1 [Araneus ventricosus]|uniref:Uncharacterized protein n=1 Tax=Araneus ventricosus TaxID=182803 RepID=A0A4Y2IFZ9_ARAVE|nr:hypothetical protein AVEN_48793-1 [Araneus ventricosus]